eukprot:1101543-Rhodomonas_salina.2
MAAELLESVEGSSEEVKLWSDVKRLHHLASAVSLVSHSMESMLQCRTRVAAPLHLSPTFADWHLTSSSV